MYTYYILVGHILQPQVLLLINSIVKSLVIENTKKNFVKCPHIKHNFNTSIGTLYL